MSWVMDCASGATRERLRRIAREGGECLLGDAINFPFMEICDALGSPDLGDDFRAPLRSRVPVLLVSGTLDARTPPGNAEEMQEGFANGHCLTVENAGHDEDTLFSPEPRIAEAIVGFLGGHAPGGDIQLPPPRFEALPLT